MEKTTKITQSLFADSVNPKAEAFSLSFQACLAVWPTVKRPRKHTESPGMLWHRI